MRATEVTYYVYILTNKSFTLYIGITNNLPKRLWEHKNKIVDGFTKRYNINRLIFYEEFTDIRDALFREKQLKGWTRKKKLALVKLMNPTFQEYILEPGQAGRSFVRSATDSG